MGVVSTANLPPRQWDEEAGKVHLLPRSFVTMRGNGGNDLLMQENCINIKPKIVKRTAIVTKFNDPGFAVGLA
jgi:hypothetical protein